MWDTSAVCIMPIFGDQSKCLVWDYMYMGVNFLVEWGGSYQVYIGIIDTI